VKLDLSRRDRLILGAIYGIPLSVLAAALAMAFSHAEIWHGRVAPDADAWEGWAFAVMIELPAIMGLLLLSIFPVIAPKKKPTIPRILFLSAAVMSLAVQQAYAGWSAGLDERLVAGGPSILAGVFVEIVFWVVGLVDQAKRDLAEEDIKAKLADMPVRAGVGDIPSAPVLSPATPAPDMATRHPDTRPDVTLPVPVGVTATSSAPAPDVTPVMSRHGGVTFVRDDSDIPQVKANVAPDTRVYVAPPRHPDTGADMSPDTSADVTPDTTVGQGDTDTDVAPDGEGDTAPDMTDPKWLKAAEMRRSGDTIKSIAEHFGVTPRTVNRWKLPAPDDTKPVNGHKPELSGVSN
jgi:Homeodomain-like domain